MFTSRNLRAGFPWDSRAFAPVSGRQPLIALLLLILLVTDLVLVVLHEAARRSASLEADYVKGILVERLDRDGERQVAATVDYAWWDEAVTHLVGRIDQDWAAANLGSYLRRRAEVDGVAVIRPDGQIAYSDGVVDTAIGPWIGRAVAEAPPAEDGGPPRALAYRWLGSAAAAVSAVPIRRFQDRGPSGDGSLLVLIRLLGTDYLVPIGDRLQLAELRATADRDQAQLFLSDPAGDLPVGLVWAPGSRFPTLGDSLAPVLMVVALAGLVLAAGIGLSTQRMARRATSLSRQLAAVFDTIDEGVLTADEYGRVDLANPAAARLLRCPVSGLVGRNVEELLHWRDGRPATIDSIVGGQRRRQVDLAVPRTDGDPVPVAVSLSRPYADQAPRYALVLRDVSESERIGARRLLLREELRATRELQGIAIMAGGIAHDMRNVLGLILGSAVMVMDEEADEASRRSDAEQIVKAAERGRDMITRLLTLGTVPDPEHEPVDLDLNLLIEETAKSFGRQLPPGVRLTARGAPGALMLRVDKTALFQILLNLCLNAVEAMTGHTGYVTLESGGSVPDDVAQGASRVVGTVPPEPRVMFGVLDTGPGLPPDRLAGLFTPLRSNKGGANMGLGLAVVARLVERLGGALLVYTLEGFGSRFDVVLPCQPPDRPAQDDGDGANM